MRSGGLAAGSVTAAGVALIRRRITDPVLETVVALVTPYAAYVPAKALGVSTVTAVVVASMLLSSRTARLTTAHTRLQLHSVYQTVVFVMESVVFALIGLQLPALISDLQSGDSGWPAQALVIAAAMIAVRVLWVFPASAVTSMRGGAGRCAAAPESLIRQRRPGTKPPSPGCASPKRAWPGWNSSLPKPPHPTR